MQVTLDIPDSVVDSLRDFAGTDLGRAAIERLALDGYKAQKLTLFQVRQLVGFKSRHETEQWLGRHQAWPNWTQADMDIECQTVDRLLAERQP